MLSSFAAVALLGQATVTDLFKSDGQLAVSNMAISNKEPKRFELTEISFSMTGTWGNALDPNQIDASANLIGPGDNFAIVYAFLNQNFVSSLEDGLEKLTPTGTPNWVMRFAPWLNGSFGAFFQFADTKSKITPPNLKFKVAKNDVDAFSLGGDSYPFLRFGKSFLFVIGKTLPKFGPGGSVAAQLEFQKFGAGSVARLVMDRTHFGPAYVEPEEIAFRPDLSMLRSAWLNDTVIQIAARANVKLILSVGSKDDLNLQTGWKVSPFNRSNGGPCDSPDEFFTNLKARVMFKRSMRYFVSRIQAYPNVVGMELFPGVDVPGYWLQEMEAEIIGLHTYGLPVSSLPTNADSAKLKTRGYASQYIEKPTSAVGLVNSCIEKVAAMRKICNYPVMLVLDGSLEKYSLIAPWAALVSGSTGLVSDSELSNKAVDLFFKRFDWAKRKMVLASVETSEDMTGWARIDDKGGILLLAAKGDLGKAGTASISLPKSGKYRIEWVDCTTGEVTMREEISTQGNTLKLNCPEVKLCSVAEFKRL